MLPVCIEPILAARSSMISTGTIFSDDADCAMRLRHASSVCTLSPRVAQTTLRRSPLCSKSETRRFASARLSLRFTATTPLAFIPTLQHSANPNGRMALPERVRLKLLAVKTKYLVCPCHCVHNHGMFLRSTTRKKDVTEHRYWSVVENAR